MLPEPLNRPRLPPRFEKLLTNVEAALREHGLIRREAELLKEQAMKTLMESQALLERADEILSKNSITSRRRRA
jgi:hypothetical protein